MKKKTVHRVAAFRKKTAACGNDVGFRRVPVLKIVLAGILARTLHYRCNKNRLSFLRLHAEPRLFPRLPQNVWDIHSFVTENRRGHIASLRRNEEIVCNEKVLVRKASGLKRDVNRASGCSGRDSDASADCLTDDPQAAVSAPPPDGRKREPASPYSAMPRCTRACGDEG